MSARVSAEDHRPFHDASGGGGLVAIPRRRLLLVSYHFPPDTAVGGLRWQRLSRYIAERGWGLDVVARDLRTMKVRDDRRLDSLPPTVRVYASSEGDPVSARLERFAIKMIRRAVRRKPSGSRPSLGKHDLATPSFDLRHLVRAHGAWISISAEKLWARSATQLGRSLARENRYDAVLSSGPPHMAHEAARRIATEIGIPLIANRSSRALTGSPSLPA